MPPYFRIFALNFFQTFIAILENVKSTIIFNLLGIIYLLVGCVPIINDTNNTSLTTNKKVFTTQEKVYEPHIRTIELHRSDDPEKKLPPIISLSDNRNHLQLNFDVLGEEQEDLQAKIIHCNADWHPSILNEIEYLNDFNEFPMRDFQFSNATRVPYSHYRFTLPPLKVSGNYILMLYRDGNPEDLLFTRRFVVYESRASINPKAEVSSKPSERERNQQIAFDVSLNNYQINNAQGELKALVRQNYRWDYTIDSLKPSTVRDFEKKVEYRPFDLSNNFKGGNEFRQFSCESRRFLGLNIAQMSQKGDTTAFILLEDLPRDKQSYLRRPDRNGQYIIKHHESQRGSTESDYVKVTFRLRYSPQTEQKIYVIGEFNNWEASEKNRLKYDKKQKYYSVTLLLKQGYYDYMYAVSEDGGKNLDVSPIEGSHQATENAYDILLYHRPPSARADQVIAYRRFSVPDE